MKRHDDELAILSLRRQHEHDRDRYGELTVDLYQAVQQAHDDGMDTGAIAAQAGLPVVTVVEYLARRDGRVLSQKTGGEGSGQADGQRPERHGPVTDWDG